MIFISDGTMNAFSKITPTSTPNIISGALYEREHQGQIGVRSGSDDDSDDNGDDAYDHGGGDDADGDDEDDDDDDDDMMLTPMRTTRMLTTMRTTTTMAMMLISSDFVGRPTFGQHSPGNSRKGCATIGTLSRNCYPI